MEKNHQETPQVPQVDAYRRRLTKAGLAVPAVIGVLAGKSVLGADLAHGCTLSGQVSGNVSTHGAPTSCDLGDTPSEFNALNQLPGSLNKNSDFVSLGFSDLFKRTTNSSNARITDVLSGNFTTKPNVNVVGNWKELAQAALASYLNVKKYGTAFPLDTPTVLLMFNATVVPGGLYTPADWVRSTVSWDHNDVLCYFKLLYGGVTFCSGLST